MTIFNNTQDEIDSTCDVVEFLNAKRNIVDLFYNNRVLFEEVVEFLEEFYSLDQYDLDYGWVKITSIDDMPDDLNLKVKELILEFESGIGDMLDGNEWGKTYNLTTDEDYGIRTDGLPDSVSLEAYSENNDDELLTIHIHPIDVLPSDDDIMNCIDVGNNVKYVVIVAPQEVLVMESYNFSVSKDIIREGLDESLTNAFADSKNNLQKVYYSLKVNYIKNNILNKYIKFYWWFK